MQTRMSTFVACGRGMRTISNGTYIAMHGYERYTSGVSVVHIGSVRGTHRECIHWCEWYTSEMDFSSDLMVYMKQGQIYTKRYTRMHTLVSGVYIENAPSLQLFLPHIPGQKPRIKKLCGRFILLHTQPYTRTNAHARATPGDRGSHTNHEYSSSSYVHVPLFYVYAPSFFVYWPSHNICARLDTASCITSISYMRTFEYLHLYSTGDVQKRVFAFMK